jgi:hypothetical protein
MNFKKIIYNFGKIIWLIIGIGILAWTIYWYYKIRVIGNIGGVLVSAILLGTGIYAMMFFMLITILFIISKFLIKKRKNKK